MAANRDRRLKPEQRSRLSTERGTVARAVDDDEDDERLVRDPYDEADAHLRDAVVALYTAAWGERDARERAVVARTAAKVEAARLQSVSPLLADLSLGLT